MDIGSTRKRASFQHSRIIYIFIVIILKMFRESDYQPPVLHATYHNKPRPELQMKSLLSKLEEAPLSARDRCVATVSDPMPAPIPATYDCAYDPSHPDADWAGLRSLDRPRKHVANHRSQAMNLVHEEHGIIGAADKHKNPKKGPVPESYLSSQRDGPLIGGIDVRDHFKTTYQQLVDHDQTSREQLCLQKRMLPKRQLSPRSSENRSQNGLMQATNPYGNIAGFYQPAAINSNKSLLSNLGASLVGRQI